MAHNDAHCNRVLYVTLDGQITQLLQFGDVVPTGLARLARWGTRVYNVGGRLARSGAGRAATAKKPLLHHTFPLCAGAFPKIRGDPIGRIRSGRFTDLSRTCFLL